MFGLSRQNSVASTANHHPPSQASTSLRRCKTTATSRPLNQTKSELLNSTEKSKQAVSAAQRAFAPTSRSKPLVAQQQIPSSFITPPSRRQGLVELDTNQDGRVNVRYSRYGAPPNSVTSRDYSGESSYSPSPIPAGLGRFYAERYADYGEDDDDDDYFEGTIVRKRWSMPVQAESGICNPRFFSGSTVVPDDDEDLHVSGFTPEPVASQPSSFKRLGRSKSSAVFNRASSSNNTAQPNSRKSTSFLRGGTDFMPESMKNNPKAQFKPRERRSYYTSSEDRPVFPEDTMSMYKRNDRGEWGALRYAVKRKTRKITDLFGSVRVKLGIKSKNEDGLMGIPEQHVAASRPYFAPEMSPVSQEERIRPLGPREQPQKIRSSFIVARAPSLHHVHSDEVLQSYQGSVREPTPEVEVEHVEDPYGTVSTCNSLAWKSTLSSRTSTIRGPPAALEKPPLESIFERDLQTPCPPEGQERINAPRHRKDRYHVDVRRLYSALVKNLDEKPPVLKPIPPKIQDTSIVNSPSDQHDHHAFQTYRTALNPVSTLEKTGSDVVRRSSRVTFEEPPRRTPPPIPERPSNYQRRKPTGQADADAYDHSESSDAPLAKQEGPQHATPVKKSRTRVSFAAPKSATCGVLKGDDSLNRTDNVRDHVTSTEINATPETKLPDWNHPFLGKSPSFTIASNVGAWKSRMQPYSPTTPVHRYMAFESPIADAASMIRNDHFGIIRSKSVVESPYKSPYNREETRTPLQRTQTAFGFRKTGNTMGELDISAAVRAQFGPVAGDEGEYDEQDFEGWMNRSYLG